MGVLLPGTGHAARKVSLSVSGGKGESWEELIFSRTVRATSSVALCILVVMFMLRRFFLQRLFRRAGPVNQEIFRAGSPFCSGSHFPRKAALLLSTNWYSETQVLAFEVLDIIGEVQETGR